MQPIENATTEKETKEPGLNTVQIVEIEKKREVISVQVTPEEKRTITRMAVKDCGISVSEFVRTKVFMEQKTIVIDETKESPITDEERIIYEEKLSERNAEVKKLKDDIVRLKVASSNPNETKEEVIIPEVEENVLKVILEPQSTNVFNRIKSFREEKLKTLSDKEKIDFISFEKYLIILLIRGMKRSYYGGILNSNLGLTTDDLREMSEAEGIDYDEVI